MVEKMFWLSFASTDKFLGACLVQGETYLDAVQTSKKKGCNPGGEVLMLEIPVGKVKLIPEGWTNRLLTREQCEEFDRALQQKMKGGLN